MSTLGEQVVIFNASLQLDQSDPKEGNRYLAMEAIHTLEYYTSIMKNSPQTCSQVLLLQPTHFDLCQYNVSLSLSGTHRK